MTYSLVYKIYKSNLIKKIIQRKNEKIESELEEMRKYNVARLKQYKIQQTIK